MVPCQRQGNRNDDHFKKSVADNFLCVKQGCCTNEISTISFPQQDLHNDNTS